MPQDQGKNILKYFNKIKTETNSSITYTFINIDDYREKGVIFVCKEGHRNTLCIAAFVNKKCFIKSDYQKLCVSCITTERKDEKILKDIENDIIIREIYNATGHQIIDMRNRKDVDYKCGNCGEEQTGTSIGNLKKSAGFCHRCQNDSQRKSLEDVIKLVESAGLKCLDTEYTNRSTPIRCLCTCGHEYYTYIRSIRQGKKCMKCRLERTMATNMKRYGYKNTFQVPKFKEKMRITCMNKYGVPHHLKVPEIFAKQVKTWFQTKKFTFPSGRTEIVMGYEPIAIKSLLSGNVLTIDRPLDEKEIIVGVTNIPTINYIEDNIERTYYPDILIEMDDRKILVEVKSVWSFNISPMKNYLKFVAAADSGYTIHVMIYRNSKSLYDIWVFDPDKEPESVNYPNTIFYESIKL